MNEKIPFQAVDWTSIPRAEYTGESGTAFWRTIQWPGLRLRVVEYSQGYLADHWCRKGHIVHCLDGEFVCEMQDGRTFALKKGMTFVVSDELSSHRSVSGPGAKLLIIDGDFLKS